MNGLLFSSLIFSLMSALGASLAKGWVTQYASPVSGTNWHDAFLRHRRFTGIQHWHLKGIIHCLPILIHIAFFLFAVGITILLFQNDVAIGGVIISLVAIITVLYIGSTIHPVYFPDSPFRTPVSSLIAWFFNRGRITSQTLQLQDDDVAKAQALGWLLIESADSQVIQGCVQAIAGLPLQPHMQHVLYPAPVADVLCKGLSECVQGSENSTLLRAYLYAVLHLVQTGPSPTDNDFTSTILLSLVEHGGPLHLLQGLQPDAQGIALCVKGRILLLYSNKVLGSAVFNTDIPVMLKASNGHLQLQLQEVYLLAKEPKYLESLKSSKIYTQINAHQELSEKADTGMFVLTKGFT